MKNHHPPNQRGALFLRCFAPTLVKLRPLLALISLGITPLAKANWVAGRDLIANEGSAATEIVNPNPTAPAWSYGHRVALASTPLSLFTAGDHINNIGGFAGLDGFRAGGLFPFVMVNTTAAPIVRAGMLNLNPGDMELHPASNGELAIVRWTAPTTGTFSISATFEDLNPSTGNSADGAVGSIVVNGLVQFTNTWINGGPAVSVALPNLNLNAGDKVDFAVGMNGNYASDSTRLNATITALTPPAVPSLLPVDCDEAVVTCYSGVTGNPATGPVDPNGFVVAVIDTRNPAANGAVLGNNWIPPMYHNENGGLNNIWNARNLGQVFGITLDRATKPNIYVAATSIYGLAPLGYALSQSYGPGGPGAVYKLDGVTGAISTFASLPNTIGAMNKAPSLGNICFDRMRNQFFVSNLEDGLIYRLDLSGNWSSAQTYDHGKNGRPNVAPRLSIADDGVMGVMTQLERRVWGLNVFDNRLYYGVWSEDLAHGSNTLSNEVWSVGFDAMGLPDASTAKLEITLPVNTQPYWVTPTLPLNFSSPVSDITFDDMGHMILAERSMPFDAHLSRVLEYQLNTSTGAWVLDPKKLYTGSNDSPNSSAGGVDLACDGKIWATADYMKLPPTAAYAYGLAQIPRAGNTLANLNSSSYIIDYNPPQFSVDDKTQVGDVVINRQCCECALVKDIKVTCVPRPAPALGPNYTWTFQLVNTTPTPIGHVSFMDTPGFTVSGGQIYNLPTPLASGSATNITVTLIPTSLPIPDHVCLHMGIHSAIFETCCEIVHCVELSECCAEVTNMCLTPDPKGNGDWTLCFDYTNLSPNEVSWVFMVPAAGYLDCVTSLVLPAIPPLAPGQKQTFCKTVTIDPDCRKLCLIFSGHTANFAKCCSITKCLEVPCICKDKTWTLNEDFDRGTLINLNHNPANQLQINGITQPMPFVCIPCSKRGTVVRIDINEPNPAKAVVGEYWSAPASTVSAVVSRNPSRTTVDKYGNVWVGNRGVSGASSEKLDGSVASSAAEAWGSVVRIGVVIGGTRGNCVAGNFTPNPLGQYLKGPFSYNTCVDRDGDGCIKTSRGLGDVLPWNNASSADTGGGVSTAEDEAITIYTRVPGSGTRFLAIDCYNNLWTSGWNNEAPWHSTTSRDQDFQAVDGVTGLLIPNTFISSIAGGYGGLIDGFGHLWGGRNLARLDVTTQPPTVLPVANGSVYGLGIDPRNCHVFSSTYINAGIGGAGSATGIIEFDPSGNPIASYPMKPNSLGICVDGSGHVFSAAGSSVYHLTPNVGTGHTPAGDINIPTSPHPSGGPYVRGVAVDTNGDIWAADYNGNSAHRISHSNYTVDKTIDLGSASSHPLAVDAQPYNYSDMTGFVALGATCREGSWTVFHDGGCEGAEWGVLTWTAQNLSQDNRITVEIRADDVPAKLSRHDFYTRVRNGKSFCGRGIIGRWVELRVRFNARPCSTDTPILTDLRLTCCRSHSDCIEEVLPPIAMHTPPVGLEVPTLPGAVTGHVVLKTSVAAPSGGVLVLDAVVRPFSAAVLPVTHDQGISLGQITIPASGPPTVGTYTVDTDLALGRYSIGFWAQFGEEWIQMAETAVNVGDQTPPVIAPLSGQSVIGWTANVPNFLTSLQVTDASYVVLSQTPAPGTPKAVGSYPITITATDAAGNLNSVATSFTVSPDLQLLTPEEYSVFNSGVGIQASAVTSDFTSPPTRWYFLVNGLVVTEVAGGNRNALVTLPNLAPGNYNIRVAARGPNEEIAEGAEFNIITVKPPASQGAAPLPSPSLTITNGNICLCVQAAVGQNCVVETSTDLLTWAPLPNGSFVGDGTLQELTFPKANPPEAKRYYRIRYVSSTP